MFSPVRFHLLMRLVPVLLLHKPVANAEKSSQALKTALLSRCVHAGGLLAGRA